MRVRLSGIDDGHAVHLVVRKDEDVAAAAAAGAGADSTASTSSSSTFSNPPAPSFGFMQAPG